MLLEKRAQTPVEQRSYSTYYLVFSGILFLGTMWSVWDEVSVRRPWKDYQNSYHALAIQKLDSLRAEAVAGLDSALVLQLQVDMAKAQEALNSEEYQTAVSAKTDLQKELDVATREWRFARSRSDAAYYEYKKKLQEGKTGSDLRQDLEKQDASIVEHAGEMESLNARIATLDIVINKYKDVVDSLQAEQIKMLAPISVLDLKLERAHGAPVQIRQVMLNDFEFTPFNEIKARIDRCQTCHAGWADPLMEEEPQPFTSHPLPELLAKHNPESFGCTPCHRGQGPALTAGFAHGDDDHYWETPLLRGADTYATCNTCHANELVLKDAKPFTKAKQIVYESGCFGCHEIKGYGEAPKIGPPLNNLTAKTTPEWIFSWVRNPKEYNPHTRMPNFEFNEEQAEAITAYLVKIGNESDYRAMRTRGSYAGGSVTTGKKLFESVGCQACHTLGDTQVVRQTRETSYDIAPELTRVGSKVSPDWLFDWLKNPRHYNTEARMPSLRLTDDEARNLVAFLSAQKDDRPSGVPPLNLSSEERILRGDRLIREYGCAGCHSIKGMENEGKVSVSLSDFGRKKYEQMDYGDTKELSKYGKEEYVEYEDGTVGVQHTWAGWVWGKLKNARRYQTERIPQKMPLYSFSDEEVRLLRMFLLSMSRDVPLPAYQHAFDKRMQDIEEGRRLTLRYNCVQCHAVEDRGGYVVAQYEEPALGPPLLPESQGAKVQEAWLHEFLKAPSTIRPWLEIRMPTFSLTDAEISKVTKYFLGLSKQELSLRDYAATPIEEEYLAPGRRLFETYQCAKCHPTGNVRAGGEVSASDLAPNLTLAAGRLKPEWIIDWLHDPSKLQPGTRMPAYFYEGKGPDETVFQGDAAQQIKALKTYVWSLGARRRSAVAQGN
ncbi:MAG: c-type cytochrome [Bacteroidota bacterium]